MVTFTSMRTADEAAAFGRLSEAWIVEHFALEPADRASMDDPFGHYTASGGDVVLARDGDEVIGCCALVALGDGVFELSKMTIAGDRRGGGLGRQLLDATIARARELGATSLFLGSNHVLRSAVALYERAGFEHVPREAVGPLPYTRADVFMRLAL